MSVDMKDYIAYQQGYEAGKRDAVVRCGECKHRNDLTPTKWHPCVDMAVDDDWYCADGEREVQE